MVLGILDEVGDLVNEVQHAVVGCLVRGINFDSGKDSGLESSESGCVGGCAHVVLKEGSGKSILGRQKKNTDRSPSPTLLLCC